MAATNQDPKSQLNQFVMRKCRVKIDTSVLFYTLTHVAGGMQSTLKLVALDGLEFAGEICPNMKAAEKSAAQQALTHFQAEYEALMLEPSNRAKRINERPEEIGADGQPVPKVPKIAAAVTPGAALSRGVPAKSQLGEMCAKILKKPPTKGDVTYQNAKLDGGAQSIVTMSCLPDEWALQPFAGEVMPTQNEAENSAAEVAMAAMRADAKLMALLNAKTERRKKAESFMANKAAGGGKGKGKAQSPMPGMDMNAMMTQMLAMGSNQWGGGGAGGKGAGGGMGSMGGIGGMGGLGGGMAGFGGMAGGCW